MELFEIKLFSHLTVYKRNFTNKMSLVTLLEVNPKALFSIATTARCEEGLYSIPWIAAFYPWSVPYNAEC